MKRKREAEQPDAHVYRRDDGRVSWFCAECVTAHETPDIDLGAAFRHAQSHLWSNHSRRRVWIDYSSPGYARAVQQALPLVIAHNTTRHD